MMMIEEVMKYLGRSQEERSGGHVMSAIDVLDELCDC